MAGGMGRPWSGPTLADRSADSSAAADRVASTPHCWVVDVPDHPGRHAGLLLEWRRNGRRWMGLVTFVLPEVTGERVRLLQQWLPAECLKPADRP
ncbi:MAG TPA: hypothetical protein VLR26_02075 [Frankiaceae bacterium]|nr:hypothetical protein [Frankiaceae bacterium]